MVEQPRRRIRGTATFSAMLGAGSALAFCLFVYFASSQTGKAHDNALPVPPPLPNHQGSGGLRLSLGGDDPAPPPADPADLPPPVEIAQNDRVLIFSGSRTARRKTTSKLLRDQGASTSLFDDKQDLFNDDQPANTDQDDEEPQGPPDPPAGHPAGSDEAVDKITTARTYEYYRFVDYGFALHDRGGSYYLEVILKSHRTAMWDALSRDEWIKLKRRTWAVDSQGRTGVCEFMWPEGLRGEGAILVNMVFVCPTNMKVKQITIDKEAWQIRSVTKGD